MAKVKLPHLREVDNWVCPSSVMSQREISEGLRRDLKQPLHPNRQNGIPSPGDGDQRLGSDKYVRTPSRPAGVLAGLQSPCSTGRGIKYWN